MILTIKIDRWRIGFLLTALLIYHCYVSYEEINYFLVSNNHQHPQHGPWSPTFEKDSSSLILTINPGISSSKDHFSNGKYIEAQDAINYGKYSNLRNTDGVRPMKMMTDGVRPPMKMMSGKAQPSNDGIKNRIAILLPYIGKTLPIWFDLFAFTAYASSDMIDWYIFISDAPNRVVPSNVFLVRMKEDDIYERVSRLNTDYMHSNDSFRIKMSATIRKSLKANPYFLVELKPALGYMFPDYIKTYSHWGYGDLDLLVGRVSNLITWTHLSYYDIITFSFGDNNRLYLRGQLTIHKNNNVVNNIWRGCRYLSEIGTERSSSHLPFESAEGCYSKVVADRDDIDTIYIPVQFTDANRDEAIDKETIIVGDSLLRCFQQPIEEDGLMAGMRDRADAVKRYKADIAEQNVKLSDLAASTALRRLHTPTAEDGKGTQ